MKNVKNDSTILLKRKLDEAMEAGKIPEIDALSEEIMEREGLAPVSGMPDGFPEQIQRIAEMENAKNERRKNGRQGAPRRIFVFAAAFVLLLVLGTAAYAAGWMFPKEVVDSGTSRIFPFGEDSPEYKAASEYVQNWDREKTADFYDPWEHPIYGDEEKVEELSRKYGLRFATEKTALRSLPDVKKQLENRKLDGIFAEPLMKKIGRSIETLNQSKKWDSPQDYNVKTDNFVLNDGTMSLGWRGGSPDILSCSVTFLPKGTFPYMELENEMLLFDSNSAQGFFTQKTKSGKTICCVPRGEQEDGASSYTAFCMLENQCVVISADIKAEKPEEKMKELLGQVSL